MEKNSLIKKLKGYQKASRGRFLLLKDGVLTQEEFLLYELGIAITDWDETHTDSYGTFQATNQDLAGILGWESDSTVSRYRTSLIAKGFLLQVDSNIYKAKDFSSWELKKSSAKMQNTSAKIEDSPANSHEESAKMQEDRSSGNDSSLVSFKGDLSSFKEGTENIPDGELEFISKQIDQQSGNPSVNAALQSHDTSYDTSVDPKNPDEQMVIAKEVFGEGSKWNE